MSALAVRLKPGIEFFDLGVKAPDFTLPGIPYGLKPPIPISLSQYRGQWVILWFYGSDFTFV